MLKSLAFIAALLASASVHAQSIYIQGSQTPGTLSRGGPGAVTIDANGAASIAAASGTGTVVYGTGGTLTNPTMTTPHITTPMVNQGAPTAQTVSATLTAAALVSGIITVNQAAGAASVLTLPLATAMDTALTTSGASDSIDFSVINTSTVDAEDASVATNTGWTLVGNMDVPAYSAAGSLNSSGRFRARKTGAGAWVLYRLS
jgi:hypothetical protein